MLRATALKISEVLLKTEGGEVTLTPETGCFIDRKSPKCSRTKHKHDILQLSLSGEMGSSLKAHWFCFCSLVRMMSSGTKSFNYWQIVLWWTLEKTNWDQNVLTFENPVDQRVYCNESGHAPWKCPLDIDQRSDLHPLVAGCSKNLSWGAHPTLEDCSRSLCVLLVAHPASITWTFIDTSLFILYCLQPSSISRFVDLLLKRTARISSNGVRGLRASLLVPDRWTDSDSSPEPLISSQAESKTPLKASAVSCERDSGS